MHEYRNKINEGIFPISKNYILNNDDIIRRECNFELQCNQVLNIKTINEKYKIDFTKYFSEETKKLKDLEKKGFLHLTNDQIKVTTVAGILLDTSVEFLIKFLNENSQYECSWKLSRYLKI